MKVSKSIIFLVKSFLGNFFIDIWRFFLVALNRRNWTKETPKTEGQREKKNLKRLEESGGQTFYHFLSATAGQFVAVIRHGHIRQVRTDGGWPERGS